MLHYLWPRRLRRQQKESVCIRRTKKLLLHVGGAGCRGGGVGLLGWIFNFCFCAFSHFHSLRYAAAARGENNQLQQTEADTVQGACTGRAGEGGMEVGMQ